MENKLIIKSAVKIFSLLEYLSNLKSGLNISELSKHLQISMGSAQRITETLLHLGYLDKDPKTKVFELSKKWLHIGFAAINKNNICGIALPYLKQLNSETRETVSLATMDNNKVIYLERLHTFFSTGPIGAIGMVKPIHCNSIGKVILAFLDETQRNIIVNTLELKKYTDKTLVKKTDFISELHKIRQLGYALNDGEQSSDMFAMAVPIVNKFGIAIAGINIGIPKSRLTKNIKNEFLPLLIEKGKQISNDLFN